MNNLEDIKDRLAAATPGPWRHEAFDAGHSRYEMNRYILTPDTGDVICDMDGLGRSNNEKHAQGDGADDAEFIAHAPEDIARLVKALEAVQEQLLWAEACKTQWTSADALRAKITEALDS